MDNDIFDKAFDVFVESEEYDKAQNALLHYMNVSFQAGWIAAGCKPPQEQPKIKLYSQSHDNESSE